MFGDKVKKLRKRHDLTQKELAQKLGVSPAAIGLYEQNRRIPDVDVIKNIAKIFSVSTDYLLDITDTKKNTDVPIDKLYPEVNDVEEAMKIIMDQPGLMLKGEILTDEDKLILANSIQIGLRLAEERRRERKEKT